MLYFVCLSTFLVSGHESQDQKIVSKGFFNWRKVNEGIFCVLLGRKLNSIHRIVVKCCEYLMNQ
jgi:hypothetical protein